MKPLSIKRNGYLYRPGAESRYMYIVIEGCFEVSMTINEKHLHLLKKYYQIQNIEGSPRIHR